MKFLKKLDWDIVEFVFLITVLFGMIILVIKNRPKIEEEETKKECYEIYASDGVILKKCQKYFEGEK